MPYFTYNPDAQRKSSPMSRESYIKNIPPNRLWSPKEGTHRIRLLPPWSAAGLWARYIQIHWEVGLAKTTFICPNVLREGTCPFCQLWGNLKNEYDKYEPDISFCRPAKKWYANMIDLNNPGMGVLAYSFGKTIYQAIQGIQDSGEYGDVTHPVTGTDFTLTRTGQGRLAKDAIFPARQPTPIQNPQWLDQMFNLDDIYMYPSIDDVTAAFESQPWKVWKPVGTSIPTFIPVGNRSGPILNAPVSSIPPPQNAQSAPVVRETPATITNFPAPVVNNPIPAPEPVQAAQPTPSPQPVQNDQTVASKFAAVAELEAALKAKLQPSS